MALLLIGGVAVAVEVLLLDGTHGTKSSDDVKRAYLVGLANQVQIEAA